MLLDKEAGVDYEKMTIDEGNADWVRQLRPRDSEYQAGRSKVHTGKGKCVCRTRKHLSGD